ncbi:hypothetical protein GCM10010174_89710 [Kutzneria viridogrisea]|uniref:Uncharacterized membrane protein YhaH (DUF805 family) n=1 Tax=Kutzneria viridogrisea TaxID=47990 RepID=A0ABR6BR91_9PSEU|nr:uncharacterized membrane protein YhaH (DUF805 family) [Kutzneria viridogrisea]
MSADRAGYWLWAVTIGLATALVLGLFAVRLAGGVEPGDVVLLIAGLGVLALALRVVRAARRGNGWAQGALAAGSLLALTLPVLAVLAARPLALADLVTVAVCVLPAAGTALLVAHRCASHRLR